MAASASEVLLPPIIFEAGLREAETSLPDPKIVQVMDHFKIESHGELGYLHFRKPSLIDD